VALGFVSLLMDTSSEMVHALLPVFLVGTLSASVATVGLIEGIAEATASVSKLFSGVISDWVGRRKPLVLLGYGLAAVAKKLVADLRRRPDTGHAGPQPRLLGALRLRQAHSAGARCLQTPPTFVCLEAPRIEPGALGGENISIRCWAVKDDPPVPSDPLARRDGAGARGGAGELISLAALGKLSGGQGNRRLPITPTRPTP
jgi:hypothetical protein